ncbi:helix-turn-helix domain-containing protein [Paenibacillus sp. GCM10023252]|uniref:helix-turn-helix domain-containing protein n=1 Tax=Paenibacillus sp. GCM10023252 TaxID=3252649 RepID=UPI00360AAAAA
MNRIVPMNLGPSSIAVSYRLQSKDTHWQMYHAHQGIELLYIHEGKGTITVDQQSYPLMDGTLICFQPYQLHKVDVPLQGEEVYIRTNFTFNPRALESYLGPFPRLLQFLKLLEAGTLPEQVFHRIQDERLQQLVEDTSKLEGLSGEDLEEERALLLISLLRHLQQHILVEWEPGGQRSTRTAEHVNRMMDWVEQNYKDPFELERMAVELHLSTYHLSHLFKQYTGSTLTSYITERRIREACSLLANTDRPVKDIGESVGGLGFSYFCQLFKRHKGVTPQAYRAATAAAYE